VHEHDIDMVRWEEIKKKRNLSVISFADLTTPSMLTSIGSRGGGCRASSSPRIDQAYKEMHDGTWQ
jgi:hypothetical protein